MKNYSRKHTDEISKVADQHSGNVVAWGLSQTTRDNIKKNTVEIDYIIDNNKTLIGNFFDGVPVIGPDSLSELNNPLVIVWGNHSHAILTQLQNMDVDVVLDIDQIRPILNVTEDYFSAHHTIETKKKLFKNIVSLVELEPHSYCNRTCWFCPNSFLDRISEVHYMDPLKYSRLLDGLASIAYDKRISFTRYSEPFSDEIFYSRLREAREKLPRATLHANTNADFLTNETLARAYKNGLASLWIQLYLGAREEFNLANVEHLARKIQNKVSDIRVSERTQLPGRIEYLCEYRDMKVLMYARDFRANGVDRGGIDVRSSKMKRAFPCSAVFSEVYIDFNGTIVPCCNIRSDHPSQLEMSFGSLSEDENSIFEIFFSEKALQWRHELFTFAEIEKYPCASCPFSPCEDNRINREHVAQIKKILAP